MPTLKYRRLRGDMIETFKIINGIYDRDVTDGLLDLDQNTRTRGNDKKLKKKYSKLNILKFSFTNRIVDIWNSLPNEVITAKTVNNFEINLDKYWEAQEFKYDHPANINLTSTPRRDVKSRSSIVEEEVDIVVSASQRPQSNLT
jgi:V8-like Glu-specific endopeptidase